MHEKKTEAFVRKAWVEASHFHSLTPSQVLKEVARRVQTHQKHPLVLFDLDSTLYEVGPRTLQILTEWRDSHQSHGFSDVREALSKLSVRELGYSIADTFGAIGLGAHVGDHASKGSEALRDIQSFWAKRFFTNSYLKYDHAYPGASEFVRSVYDLGAEVVYLTGRDEPGMGDGTRANLLRDGFPWEVARTHLLLKPNFQEPDLKHKVDAAHYIRQHGVLVASFENEPPNIVGLMGAFPEAMHVFVDTVCSEHPAAALQGLYRISGFENEA